jgi:hypothetical protein
MGFNFLTYSLKPEPTILKFQKKILKQNQMVLLKFKN